MTNEAYQLPDWSKLRFAILSCDLTPHLPDDWQTHHCSSWQILTQESLPVLHHGSSEGKTWLLGYPLSPHTETPPADLIRGIKSSDDVPRLVTNMAGRFLLIWVDAETLQIYPDAAASLSMVYHRKAGIITSSKGHTFNLPRGKKLADSSERNSQVLEVSKRSGTWFPAGQTPSEDWQLLLPNHFYSHKNGKTKVTRFWPLLPSSQARLPFLALRALRKQVSAYIASIAKSHPLEIPITAGEDSRMLLACARQNAASIHLSTDKYNSSGNAQDIETGKAIAADLELPHTMGDSTDPRRSTRVLLPGFAGEALRAYYGEDRGTFPTLSTLLKCICAETEEEKQIFTQPLETWLAGLPDIPAPAAWDLAYIELRLATTMAPRLDDYDEYHPFSIMAFASHSVFKKALEIGDFWKKRGLVGPILLVMGWPALIFYPNNSDRWRPKPRTLLRVLYLISRFFSPRQPEAERFLRRS